MSKRNSPRNDWDDEDDDGDWEDDDPDADDSDADDPEDDEPTVPCPYCRREIHEEALQCPYCEHYISAEDAPSSPKPLWIVMGAIACLAVIYFWLFGFRL